jgi:hypothetical protein
VLVAAGEGGVVGNEPGGVSTLKVNGVRLITEDTYPDEVFRLNARDRYRRSLKSGNRMPLMAEEEEAEEVTIVRSNKRAFSEPDGSQTHALKRRRGGDRGRGVRTCA